MSVQRVLLVDKADNKADSKFVELQVVAEGLRHCS
jgi:hypothetical protein